MKSAIQNISKNTIAIIALLFSIVLLQAQPVEFEPLDNFGDGTLRLIGQRHYDWSTGTGNWASRDTYNLKYNANGLLLERNRLDYKNATWIPAGKYSIAYNAENLPISETDTFFASLNTVGERFLFDYNTKKLKNEEIEQQWDVVNFTWENLSRRQISYFGTDSINTFLYEMYDDVLNSWAYSGRRIYHYDSQNLDTMRLFQTWDKNANQFKNRQKELYAYNADGLRVDYILQDFSSGQNTFYNQGRSEYTYDANKRLATIKYSSWWNPGVWKNSSLTTYAYNAQGFLENVLVEQWDELTLSWFFISLETYTYNSANQLITKLEQDANGTSFVNKRRHNYTRNSNGYCTRYEGEYFNNGTWLKFQAYDNWFEANPFTGIQETQQEKLFVFPNPSNSPVTFVNADKNMPYEVYDMQGRMILQGELQPGTNSIILNEAKGNYILKAGNSSTVLVKQ